MSESPAVVYGPWRLSGFWGLRITAPPPAHALPGVERDWSANKIGQPAAEDWRAEASTTAREVAAELLRVAAERDRYKALSGRQTLALAEAGTILEALRLAVIDELAPEIMRAIEPALVDHVRPCIADPDGQQAAAELAALREDRADLQKLVDDLEASR